GSVLPAPIRDRGNGDRPRVWARVCRDHMSAREGVPMKRSRKVTTAAGSSEDTMSAPFDGKVALVAGASRGIGAATARAFAEAGASVAGVSAFTTLAAYVAGKAGIIGLTKVAALDYADRGIRVNVVAPGPILTEHLERAGEEAQRGAALSVPMRRIGRPDEVAAVV